MRLFCSLILLLLASTTAFAAGLADSPWKITADRFTRTANGNDVIAEGNVELLNQAQGQETVTLRADWLRYDSATGLVHAKGNVHLKTAGQVATAGDAQLLLNEQTGVLKHSTIFFEDRNLYFASEEARKEGEKIYYFHNGVFTTCEITEETAPVWSIKSVEADIDIDGFIFMKHCILRLKDVPVLYFPFLTFPGHRDRQTGFMVPPEISTSDRSGYGLTTPFFINLSPSSDITLYPSYLEKRGEHVGGEFRHIFDYGTKLQLQASYLDDKLIDTPNTPDNDDNDYKDDGYMRTRRDRYWVRGKFDHEFGENLNTMVDVDFASDRDFLTDFEEEMTGFKAASRQFLIDFDRGLGESSLGWRDSSLQVNKWWDTIYFGGEAVLVDEHESHRTPGKDAVNTLPHLLNNGMVDLAGTGVNLNWDADYVNYSREEGVGMQRVDLFPRLLAPLPVGRYLEGSVLGGVRQTYYLVETHGNATYDGDTSPDRSAVYGKVDLATSVHRDFGLKIGSVSWLNHMLRPHINYSHLSHTSGQENLPDFDALDRVNSGNSIGYGLDNHFRIGGMADDKAYNRYYGLFKVSQNYNFQKTREDHPYSEVLFNLELYPLERLYLKYDTNLSVYGDGFTQYDLLTRYSHARGSFALDYRYTKFSDVHEINGLLEMGLTEAISFRGELKQSLHTNRIINQTTWPTAGLFN